MDLIFDHSGNCIVLFPSVSTISIFALNSIEKYLVKGSIIGFDEINVEAWPGETEALREWMGKRNFRIIHSKYKAAAGYLIYE